MADALHLGDDVEIVTDRFGAEGVPLGSIGVIVDDWADGSNDVEVSDADTGEVVARVRAAEGELIPHPTTGPPKEPREHGILFGRGDDLGAPVGDAPAPSGSQFGGMPGSGPWAWTGSEPPPEGQLEGEVPWELRDEPQTGPVIL